MNVPTVMQSSSLMDRISPRLAPVQLQALEQWVVIKHLGSGTTVDVWLLEEKTSRQQIACKTPHNAGGTVSLSQEAKLAAQLSHENLIRPFKTSDASELGTFAADDATFWEFLAGGTLNQLVSATGHLSVARTVTVILPLVHVTQYLHARQIVHGDISPRNVMFDLTGRPVLIDFGSTRATAHSYTRTGSPGFIAPELLTDQQFDGLDSAADVYALAAVAWFCLSGTIPGSTDQRIPLTTLQPELDPEIAEVLEAGLSALPASRPGLGRLSTAIAQWATPEPVDLHASVGEDYGLLLPTRQPQQTPPRKGLFRTRRSRMVRPKRGSTSQHYLETTKNRKLPRIVLILGALVLAGGAALTVAHEPHPDPYASNPTIEVNETEEQEDFQAVIDELAKARTAAWAATDPSLIAQYALADSSVFRNDAESLTGIADAGHRLEGIRMRAVVDDVDDVDDETPYAKVLHLTWQMDGYMQRDESGTVISEVDAREEVLKLQLVNTPDGWRMVSSR